MPHSIQKQKLGKKWLEKFQAFDENEKNTVDTEMPVEPVIAPVEAPVEPIEQTPQQPTLIVV